MKIINTIFKKAISTVYPNKCKCCGELIEEEKDLCNECNKHLERNNLENICLLCGFEKDHCVCKYNVYRFDALICVYKNTGLARDMYFNYKFRKKQHYVKFFANEMCDALKFCYKDISLDCICSVPTYNKFGYDHSRYLAVEISNRLNIPYMSGILSCAKRRKKQHRSTIKERLINADGKYKFNYRIDNACVLLIDDIKTTGATIDECAKMLLYAGAKSVYCITALGTTNKN